ncbi:MAG TPA: DNA replication/repair protein RecF [Allosphingosinicella sp.]|jgi:DNA replication and repair protein RecF
MHVARLALSDFRSYADAVVEPGPGLVILTGENGAGKTNMLEAVSLLAPGRGLRGAVLSEMARQGGPGGFAVAARLSPSPSGEGAGGWGMSGAGIDDRTAGSNSPHPNPSPEGEGLVEIGTGVAPGAPDRRQVRINGASASASSLAEWLSVLWLTPAMDRLFAEGAGGRRRFLDRLTLALFPGHAAHAARYEAAMRARNRLLGEDRWDETWLDSLEAQMQEHGVAVSHARMRTLKHLMETFASDETGTFPKARILLDNVTPGALQTRLRASRKVHAAARRSTHGPNNEDMSVYFGADEKPASQCSTGEQKALLLSIVLAHADLVAQRSGRRPILLLDEVAAHLDPRRRRALLERLTSAGGQVWVTGTEPGLFEGAAASATWLEVGGGTVSRAE